LIGDSVAHYEILELLGKGGMGVVYKARDTKLDRIVALKFLPPQQNVSREAKQRFLREARTASALDHPNICTIHEIGETETGEHYIVMGHYAGQTLRDALASGPLPVERATHLARQLAQALDRAHDAGIAHRDLKPGNIMLTGRDDLKLLDFGLAKLASATQLTQAGTMIGTIDYMSPEQADARDSDHRTDIWSFGVVLYEMLSGRLPFVAETPAAVMMSIINKEPDPLPNDVPEDLARLINSCLNRNPADRPGIADVCAALSTGSADSSDTVLIRRKPNRFRLPLLVGAAVLILVSATWLLERSFRPSDDETIELDADRIAVTPFTVRGSSDIAYLNEGIVDLISTKLSGAGGLTIVNPRAIISLVRQLDADIADPTTGRDIARRCGAGRYITGDIFELGGRIQISTYLHDSNDQSEPSGQSSAEGAVADLFNIVDGLVAELLTEVLGHTTEGVQDLAVATTHSLPALKEYLAGEQLLRDGRSREAAAAYDRAVAADSTFALAYYRKSIAADWTDAADIRASVDRAFALADKLPQPERDLVTALRLRRHGNSAEAERIYRTILHQYPDEVEALVQLAEVLFHENPRVGRQMIEAAEPFQHAADLEPNNLIAQIHLARIYAMTDNVDALVKIADHLKLIAPDSERATEVAALCAYASDDPVRQQELRTSLAGKPWFYIWYSAHGVARYARDPHAAAELVDLRTSDDPLLMSMIPTLLIARGKIGGFREFMASLQDQRNSAWDLFEAFILTSGAVPHDAEALDTVIDRLRRADPAQLLAASWLPPYLDLTERFAAFERDYFVALGLIQLDRVQEARRMIAELATAPAFEGLASIHLDAVAGLNAEILYRAGDESGALELLRSIRCDTPHAATVRAISDGSRWRFLRAELELHLGDVSLARNYYLGFDQSWSPWDTYQRPMVYQRLGQIAEDSEQTADAVNWYERLLYVWKDCDSELVDTREQIRARRDALLRTSSR
jgi:serine/threonine protein kinase/tetratricopeptide (TPR) repeat protein